MEGKERKRADDLPAGAVEQVRELLNRPRSSADFSPAARYAVQRLIDYADRSTSSARKRKPDSAANGARRWRFLPKLRGRNARSKTCGSSCRLCSMR